MEIEHKRADTYKIEHRSTTKWEELMIYANLAICKGHEELFEVRVSNTVL